MNDESSKYGGFKSSTDEKLEGLRVIVSNEDFEKSTTMYNNFSAPIIITSKSNRMKLFEPDYSSIEEMINLNVDLSPIDEGVSFTTKDIVVEEEEEEEQTKPVYSRSFESGIQHRKIRIKNDSLTFSHFETLILDDGLDLLKAFSRVCIPSECVEICSHIFNVLYKQDKALTYLEHLIEFEVSKQNSAGNLFRNNSIATHFMTCFTKALGVPYLKSTIGPVIIETLDNVHQNIESYEIDQTKIPSDQDLKQNILNLQRLIKSLIEYIVVSKHLMAKPILLICNLLIKHTKEAFPESNYTVIGGFLFLRYICPAIVVPDQYQMIEEEISTVQRRALLLVSKVLQSLANKKQFLDKDSYMKCMNDLILEYTPSIDQFFSDLYEPIGPDVYDNTIPFHLSYNEYEKSLTAIWKKMISMKEKLMEDKNVIENEKVRNTLAKIENIPLIKRSHIESATFRRYNISNSSMML